MYEHEGLMAVRCPVCGVVHGISQGTFNIAKIVADRQVSCPNGHRWHYETSSTAKYAAADENRFSRLCCENCGIPFGVSHEYFAARYGKDIACPNGHGNSTGRPEILPPPTARIGDAARDAALARLTEAFVAGEISHFEHGERSSAVLGAKTGAELAELTRDLPEPKAARVVPGGGDPDGWLRFVPVAALIIIAVFFVVVLLA